MRCSASQGSPHALASAWGWPPTRWPTHRGCPPMRSRVIACAPMRWALSPKALPPNHPFRVPIFAQGRGAFHIYRLFLVQVPSVVGRREIPELCATMRGNAFRAPKPLTASSPYFGWPFSAFFGERERERPNALGPRPPVAALRAPTHWGQPQRIGPSPPMRSAHCVHRGTAFNAVPL